MDNRGVAYSTVISAIDVCREKWNLSNKEMWNLVYKYNVISYLLRYWKDLNYYGDNACVDYVSAGIIQAGGKLPNVQSC